MDCATGTVQDIFLAPTGNAVTIPNADDAMQGPFNLPFSYTYPGGLGGTTMIEVDTNGGIALEPGTISSRRPATGLREDFLDDAPSIAVLHSDLRPGNGPAGESFTYETHTNVGPNMSTVFTVTWNMVPEFSNLGANTVQCQFWDNNDLIIRHEVTNGATSTFSALVGVSSGNGQGDCGEVDFNGPPGMPGSLPRVTIPPFSSGSNEIALTATGQFAPGERYTITANDLPAGGATVLVYGQLLPMPISLGIILADPACSLLTSSFFTVAMVDNGLGGADVSLGIPNQPSQIGATIDVQAVSAIIPPTPNPTPWPTPIFTSDAGTITVGMGLNDDPSSATLITDGVTAGMIDGASQSGNFPSCPLFGSGGVDVWYTYFATCSGELTVSLCAANGGSATFDTVMAIYTGTPTMLTEVDCNDDSCGLQSELFLPSVTAGTQYYIAVGAFSATTTTGSFNLSVNCFTPVPGDEPATAATAMNGPNMGTTVGATTSSPTGSCGNMGADTWFVYTATCTGTLTASLCMAAGGSSSGFDPVLAIFTGTPGSLNQVKCNDDGLGATCGINPETSTFVNMGDTLYIAVGSAGGVNTGPFTMAISCQ